MDEEEEIARAIRRDPRWLIRVVLVLVLALVAGGMGLAYLSRLNLGERAARGFATVTESPPPSSDRPSSP